MDIINTLLDRLLVILKAAPTYLVMLATVAGILIDELEGVAGIPPIVVAVLAFIVTVLLIAVTIIRRVTPVIADARGILPAGGPVTDAEVELLEQLAAERALGHR